MESGSRGQEEARGRAPCTTALVPWGAHSGGRAQGGPSGNITRGGPGPLLQKEEPACCWGGWRQESSEGAKVSPTTSGVGEAEFKGGKQVRESKMSPTEPGGRRIHLGNCKQTSYLPFLHGKSRTGVGGAAVNTSHKVCAAPLLPGPFPSVCREDASRPNSNHPPPRRPTCSFPTPPPPPHPCGRREQRWQSDRPKALLCHPGSLGLDSLDGPPALSLGHRTTLGSSHPCPTRVPSPVPGRR